MPAQQPSTSEANPRRKTTLFCPDCGHESVVTGDWALRTEGRRQIYDCPVCDTTITRRYQRRSLMAPND